MNISCLLSRTCSALLLSILASAAYAQNVAKDGTTHDAQLLERASTREQERADIVKARSDIAARLHTAEKACWQRFAVETCLTEQRKAARLEDVPLRERELQINRDERQDKAQERLRAIEQKQREKQVPSAVTVTPRDGSAVMSLEAKQSEAQKRAAEQARKVQMHDAAVAEKQAQQAQQRADLLQTQKEKQEAAQARRAAKEAEPASRTGAPLPIPDILPKP